MKTQNRIGTFAGMVFLLPLTLLAESAASSKPTPPPASTAPKTHTLFMGTDVSIERDKKLYRIWNVAGSNFIITYNGEPIRVQMRGEPHNLKLDQSMKLTSAAASVTSFKGERAYTPRNDPRMIRQKEQMAVTTALQDAGSLAMGQFVTAQNEVGRLSGTSVNLPNAPTGTAPGGVGAAIAGNQALADAAFKASEMTNSRMSSELATGSGARDRAENDLDLENFDAVEVDFEVASEVPLPTPYVVIIVRFHERNSKPGAWHNAIYAQSIERVESHRRKVHFLQGGFPRGFEIEDIQVHLYDHGREIATNMAPKQIALTREEAFLYLKIEYLNMNKAATLPATSASAKLNAGTSRTAADHQYRGVYFVKVSKEGMPLGIFKDEACSQPVDEALASYAADFRFFPALQKGKETEGVARLVLAEPET